MSLRILLILVIAATIYLGYSGQYGWLDADRARDLSGALVAALGFAGLHQLLFGTDR
jgi:hypothetical protein